MGCCRGALHQDGAHGSLLRSCGQYRLSRTGTLPQERWRPLEGALVDCYGCLLVVLRDDLCSSIEGDVSCLDSVLGVSRIFDDDVGSIEGSLSSCMSYIDICVIYRESKSISAAEVVLLSYLFDEGI